MKFEVKKNNKLFCVKQDKCFSFRKVKKTLMILLQYGLNYSVI